MCWRGPSEVQRVGVVPTSRSPFSVEGSCFVFARNAVARAHAAWLFARARWLYRPLAFGLAARRRLACLVRPGGVIIHRRSRPAAAAGWRLRATTIAAAPRRRRSGARRRGRVVLGVMAVVPTPVTAGRRRRVFVGRVLRTLGPSMACRLAILRVPGARLASKGWPRLRRCRR